MSFVTVMEIALEFHVSQKLVIKVLTENSLFDSNTMRPTEYSIANKLSKIKRSKNRVTGQSVEYYLWNSTHIENIFPEFALIEKSSNCQTSEDAYHAICDAFADLRIILDIELNIQKKGISEAAQAAAIQGYFSDPHFFNGRRLIFGFLSSEEVESAKEIILPLAIELCTAAKKIDPEKAVATMRSVEIVLQWLAEKAR